MFSIKKINYLFYASLSFVFSGCIELLIPSDKVGPLPRLAMYVSSRIDSTGEALHLGFSGGDYDFRNVHIDSELLLDGNRCIISLTGTSCENCFETGPYSTDRTAAGGILFPQLEYGNYDLTMIAHDKFTRGLLVVNEQGFYFQINAPYKTSFSNDISYINHTPTDAVWFRIKDSGSQENFHDLIQSLTAAGSLSDLQLAPGRYNDFIIQDNGTPSLHYYTDYDTMMVCRYNGNMTALGNAFETWQSSHPSASSARMYVHDGLGKHYE